MHADLDICIDECCKPFENHIRYSYSVLLKEVLEIKAGIPIQFVYNGYLSKQGNSDKAKIHIIPSDFFREGKYLSSGTLPGCPILWVDATEVLASQSSLCDSKLPVLFWGAGKQEIYVKRKNNIVTTNAEFIASAFFMLTRYEEIVVEQKDEYWGFPFKENLAYKEGLFHRPIVNEYAELLWDWIVALVPQARRKKNVPNEVDA